MKVSQVEISRWPGVDNNILFSPPKWQKYREIRTVKNATNKDTGVKNCVTSWRVSLSCLTQGVCTYSYGKYIMCVYVYQTKACKVPKGCNHIDGVFALWIIASNKQVKSLRLATATGLYPINTVIALEGGDQGKEYGLRLDCHPWQVLLGKTRSQVGEWKP